jgi:hypothetical protein
VPTQLENLIRQAWDRLPRPSRRATERARRAALEAYATTHGTGPRRVSGPRLSLLAAAVALAAGIGIGLALAPSGGTARGAAVLPAGPGFLPAQGWNTVAAAQPRVASAVAANVELLDAPRQGGFPQRTLERLPADGILMVATLRPQGELAGTSTVSSLSLRLEAATVSAEGRVTRYRVSGAAAGYQVDVDVYFGAPPSRSLLAEAQAELGRLAVPPVTITGVDVVREQGALPSYVPILSGAISSKTAGQAVQIQAARCGPARRAFSVFAGVHTTAGGTWRFVGKPTSAGRDATVIRESTYFRARWRKSVSNTVVARLPIVPTMFLNGKVVVVHLQTLQPMAGRRILLQQRDSAGRWIAYRSGRLRKIGQRSYEAQIRVAIPGPTIRAYVPVTSARPCHDASATDAFELSGKRAITINASYGGPQGPHQLVLTGRIATPIAGERINIYVQGCGPANPNSNVSTTFPITTPEGNWRWVYPDPRVTDPILLQAQWNNQNSRLIRVRTPLHASLKVSRRVARVIVNTSWSGQKMTGRAVELQRQAGSRWVRVARTGLRRARDHQYEARFRVRSRRLTLRGFFPAASAKPCYVATGTKPVKP